MIPPAYVRRAEETADLPRRGRVLLVMLDGGHACLVRARAALVAGDLAAFATDVCRTKAALLEAAGAVDPATDGPLAARIDELHDAMVGNLALANRERTLEHLDDVLRAFGPLLHDCRTAQADPRV
jgi:flagellin-specific chaperone FliS